MDNASFPKPSDKDVGITADIVEHELARIPGQGRFGAILLAPDRTRFRFWAPALKEVGLEIEGLPSIAMRRLDGGWFEIEAPCGAGAAYRYRVSDDLAVADPAARLMRGNVQGHSLVMDPDAYHWRCGQWRGRPWSEAVFYELHVGAFGGFAGVAEALPRLAELGITAVELMPINTFPGELNWGYDCVLPYAPSPSYGTPDELKSLIDDAHQLGLIMFLDVVYNHFGPEGNFIGVYAPPFFRRDVHNAWGCAIDFRQPEVRRFYTENALYWLREFRFDGLRFDAVHAISDPDWLDDTAKEIRFALEPERQVHLVLENDNNVASHMRDGYFDAQWNDDAHHVMHVMLTGEMDGYYVDFVEEPSARLARALSQGFVFQGEPARNRDGKPRGTPSDDLPPSAFVMFPQNHDQIGNRALGERLTTLVDPERLEAAIALQLLAPQIPLIFMGEERASKNPFLFFAQHNEELANSIREGRKSEFDLAHAELPDPGAPSTFERSIPEPDTRRGEERFALYKRLIAIRAERIVAAGIENAKSLDAHAIGPRAVIARWRLGNGSILTLATNLDDNAMDCLAPNDALLFESQPGAGEALRGGSLPPKCTVALLGRSY